MIDLSHPSLYLIRFRCFPSVYTCLTLKEHISNNRMDAARRIFSNFLASKWNYRKLLFWSKIFTPRFLDSFPSKPIGLVATVWLRGAEITLSSILTMINEWKTFIWSQAHQCHDLVSLSPIFFASTQQHPVKFFPHAIRHTFIGVPLCCC